MSQPVHRRTPSQRIKSFFKKKKKSKTASTETSPSITNSETESTSISREPTSVSHEADVSQSQSSRDNSALRKVSHEHLLNDLNEVDPRLQAAFAKLQDSYDESERSNEEVTKLGSKLQKELKMLRSEVRRANDLKTDQKLTMLQFHTESVLGRINMKNTLRSKRKRVQLFQKVQNFQVTYEKIKTEFREKQQRLLEQQTKQIQEDGDLDPEQKELLLLRAKSIQQLNAAPTSLPNPNFKKHTLIEQTAGEREGSASKRRSAHSQAKNPESTAEAASQSESSRKSYSRSRREHARKKGHYDSITLDDKQRELLYKEYLKEKKEKQSSRRQSVGDRKKAPQSSSWAAEIDAARSAKSSRHRGSRSSRQSSGKNTPGSRSARSSGRNTPTQSPLLSPMHPASLQHVPRLPVDDSHSSLYLRSVSVDETLQYPPTKLNSPGVRYAASPVIREEKYNHDESTSHNKVSRRKSQSRNRNNSSSDKNNRRHSAVANTHNHSLNTYPPPLPKGFEGHIDASMDASKPSFRPPAPLRKAPSIPPKTTRVKTRGSRAISVDQHDVYAGANRSRRSTSKHKPSSSSSSSRTAEACSRSLAIALLKNDVERTFSKNKSQRSGKVSTPTSRQSLIRPPKDIPSSPRRREN